MERENINVYYDEKVEDKCKYKYEFRIDEIGVDVQINS